MKNQILRAILFLFILIVLIALLPIDMLIILLRIVTVSILAYVIYKCVNWSMVLLFKDNAPDWCKAKKFKILLVILCVLVSTGISIISPSINHGFEEFKAGYIEAYNSHHTQ